MRLAAWSSPPSCSPMRPMVSCVLVSDWPSRLSTASSRAFSLVSTAFTCPSTVCCVAASAWLSSPLRALSCCSRRWPSASRAGRLSATSQKPTPPIASSATSTATSSTMITASMRAPPRLALRQPVPQRLHQAADGHPHLLHAVPLPDGHRLVLQRLEVDGDAERRARLVLAPGAPADALGGVLLGHEVRGGKRRGGGGGPPPLPPPPLPGGGGVEKKEEPAGSPPRRRLDHVGDDV